MTQGRRNELQSVASESRDLVTRRRRRREFKDKVGEREVGLEQQVVEGLWEMGETDREFPELYKAGTQFTCFTGIKVQILTLRAAVCCLVAHDRHMTRKYFVNRALVQVLSLLALLVEKYKY